MKNYRNKQITEAENKEVLEEYHFAGGGEYLPMTVKAKNQEEAEKIYLKERKKIINRLVA